MMRRLILAALCALALPSAAAAQVSLVSGQTASSTSGTMWVTASLDETLNLPSAVTAGNTVVAWTVFGDSRRTMSCSHDGNAMTAITVKGATTAAGDAIALLFARVATTTGTGVTCTISANDGIGVQGFLVAEFAGMAGTLSTAGGAGVTTATAAETSGTTHDSGADVTPDTTNNLFVGAIICNGPGGTWGDDGFTLPVTTTDIRLGYLIQASATAGDWVPTTTNSVGCEVVAQNLDGAAGGGGGGAPRRLSLLGVGGGL